MKLTKNMINDYNFHINVKLKLQSNYKTVVNNIN